MENRWKGAWEGPRRRGAALCRHGIPACAILPSRTVTLLRCGFLVTSYPLFFRGTGRTGLEWLHRAGAEGARRGTLPQARPGRRASLGPVPSAAPMVLEQPWYRGETKVRGAFRPGRPYARCRVPCLKPGPVLRKRAGGSRRVQGANPAPPPRPPARLSGLAVRRPRRAAGKAKASPGSRFKCR